MRFASASQNVDVQSSSAHRLNARNFTHAICHGQHMIYGTDQKGEVTPSSFNQMIVQRRSNGFSLSDGEGDDSNYYDSLLRDDYPMYGLSISLSEDGKVNK